MSDELPAARGGVGVDGAPVCGEGYGSGGDAGAGGVVAGYGGGVEVVVGVWLAGEVGESGHESAEVDGPGAVGVPGDEFGGGGV